MTINWKRPVQIIQRTTYALFLVLDLAGSALSFGAPWQTISARLAKGEGFLTQVVRRLLDRFVEKVFGEANHCQIALDAYRARLLAAPTYKP